MTLQNEQDAIKQAVEGGWLPVVGWDAKWEVVGDEFRYDMEHSRDGFSYSSICVRAIFQDPGFWQALGKARGWGGYVGETAPARGYFGGQDSFSFEGDEWELHALTYFSERLSAGDLNAFWKSLP